MNPNRTTAGDPGPAAVKIPTLQRSALPSPAALCLPTEYVQQDAAYTHDREGGVYWTQERIEMSGRWQHHVYRWALRLIRQAGLTSVIDVGCGTAYKLRALVRESGVRGVGVDMASAVDIARRHVRDTPSIRVDEIDLEAPDHALIPPAGFDLCVCADVLEHLVDPAPCVEFLRAAALASPRGGRILISTPERARLRGRDCLHSPKAEHVREWARGELIGYLGSCGLQVVQSAVLPPKDEPLEAGLDEDTLWQVGLREHSPRWCHAVLCEAK